MSNPNIQYPQRRFPENNMQGTGDVSLERPKSTLRQRAQEIGMLIPPLLLAAGIVVGVVKGIDI